jgi:pSer/pThr/pTyr-binding forkhead associated (FHA) protein
MEGILSLFEVRKGQRVIELKKDSVLIGRDPQKCDILLDPLDLSASRTHCGIARNQNNYILKDLSKNGTRINGERVRKAGQRLYHGDIIEAGNAEITFLLSEANETVERLSEAGKNNESLDPSYAIQCYSLAYRQCPTSIEYASKLLNLLEQEGRIEEIITGGAYFNPEEMMKLVDDVRIAVPIARAFVKIGDFVRATEVIELAGGKYADSGLDAIVENIKHQTGEELLKTTVRKKTEPLFFQRSNLRIYIEERADFVDLRYIERYYKYLEQQIDPLFGGSSESNVVFHVTARDHLFAQSLPDQIVILGYYSPESKRIFIRPRRWMEGRIREQDFHIVLMHEYVHFRIDDICGGMWLPRWYNEGVALNLSGSKNFEDFTNLRSVQDKCKPILLFSDATFSPVYGDPTIAYSQCGAILFYLMQGFGKEKLISVLTTMRESGEDFQHSFESTLGMSLQELDSKWWSVLEGV